MRTSFGCPRLDFAFILCFPVATANFTCVQVLLDYLKGQILAIIYLILLIVCVGRFHQRTGWASHKACCRGKFAFNFDLVVLSELVRHIQVVGKVKCLTVAADKRTD